MRVIVIGAGEVGYQITRTIAAEGSDVVVVDKDQAKLQRIGEELDVATIAMDGSNPIALKEAGAAEAEILLAVTDSDETNMITCMLAKAMFPSIKRKIARIRNRMAKTGTVQRESPTVRLIRSQPRPIRPAAGSRSGSW